jgi:hypothetical protein
MICVYYTKVLAKSTVDLFLTENLASKFGHILPALTHLDLWINCTIGVASHAVREGDAGIFALL